RATRACGAPCGSVWVSFLVPIEADAPVRGRRRFLRLRSIARGLGARLGAFPCRLIAGGRRVLRRAAFCGARPSLGLSIPLFVAGRLEGDGRGSVAAAEEDGLD